ncbi:MAG: peptidyl-prolyl cis-trans isomerase [Myxococcales bacterium]|nr:peptidyl-prolyl cis-trans isomerase [Myxococcales bacterium]MCB9754821.1 peptidyl-prolyl cis-trans isomerase [Myxococcales bacterium]
MSGRSLVGPRALVPALLAALVIGAPAESQAAAVVMDRVIAVVNDDIVLLSELERELTSSPILAMEVEKLGPAATQAQVEKKMEEIRPQVLDELIERHLIRREAARMQIPVGDADIERYLLQMAQDNGFSSVEELRAAVLESGQFGSWSDYRQMIRDQILVHVTTTYLTNFKVTEAQVREHYRKMARDVDSKIVLEQLPFIADEQRSDARDKIYARAQTVARRLRSGEPYAEVARELKMTDTRRTLGRGEIAPQLEDAIFAAKEGQVVGPLASGRGYVVFLIVEREETDVRSFEQAKDQIRAMLEAEAFERASRDFRQQLRAKAHIDIRL